MTAPTAMVVTVPNEIDLAHGAALSLPMSPTAFTSSNTACTSGECGGNDCALTLPASLKPGVPSVRRVLPSQKASTKSSGELVERVSWMVANFT